MMTIYVLLLLLPQKKATERDRERESEETKGGRVTMAMMLSDFPLLSFHHCKCTVFSQLMSHPTEYVRL